MKHEIFNARKQQVGYVEGDTYFTTRSYKKGQIFIAPKYKSAVGLDISIIRDLIKNNVKKLQIEIQDFEKKPFVIRISLMDFLIKSKQVNFDKKLKNRNITHYSEQRILSMNEWTRYYPDQKVLA